MQPPISMGFQEIEGLVAGLPHSAYTRHSWWANNAERHVQAEAWLDVGLRVVVDLEARIAWFHSASASVSVGGRRPSNDLVDHLLSRSTFLLDLSLVSSIDELSEAAAGGSFLVPATLDALLRRKPSTELADLLTEAAMPDDPTVSERDELVISLERLKLISEAYRLLADRGVVVVIPDDEVPDPELRALLESLGDEAGDSPQASLGSGSPMSPRRLIHTHLTTILNHSLHSGTAILARGRSLVLRVRGHLPTVELPDRVVRAVEAKAAFTSRFFKTRRARANKVIVAILIAGAGVFSTPIGVAGVLLALVDP